MSVFRTGISLPADVMEYLEEHKRRAAEKGYKFELSPFLADLIRDHKRRTARSVDIERGPEADVPGEVTIDASKNGGPPWSESKLS